MPLTSKDRQAVGGGLEQAFVHMGHIVKIVTSDPLGGSPGGGGGRANISYPPGTNPIYPRLFADLEKILHEIETEILKGWHTPAPPPPMKES